MKYIELNSTSQAKHQVQSRLLLNIVVGESAAILQLLACEDQTLLIWMRGDGLDSALLAIQQMQLSPSRLVSPGKRKLTSPAATPRIIQQRRASTIAQDLEEAQSNLEYTYAVASMEVDNTKS